MINNFAYVSTVLDCTGLSETSSIYSLLSRKDISVTQVCSYAVRAGATKPTFLVDDQTGYDNALAFLRDNGILATDYDPEPLLQAHLCQLRAGELIKVLLYIQKMGSFEYNPAGANAYIGGDDVTVTSISGVSPNGYTDPTPKLIPYSEATGVGYYFDFGMPVNVKGGIVTYDRLPQANALYEYKGVFTLHVGSRTIVLPVANSVRGTVSGAINDKRHYLSIEAQAAGSRFTGSVYLNSINVDGTNSNDRAVQLGTFAISVPDDTNFNGLKITDLTFSLTELTVKWMGAFGVSYTATGSMASSVIFVPSTCRFDPDLRFGHDPEGLEFIVDGITISLDSGLNSYLLSSRPTYSTSGSINVGSNFQVQCKVVATPINGTSGQIVLPETVEASSDTYCSLDCTASGAVIVRLAYAGGASPKVASYRRTTVDLVPIASTAIQTYDAKSVFELMDDLTVNHLMQWFNGERVYYDAYTAMLMDHTIMQVVTAEIEAIQKMMVQDGDMSLKSPYELDYFTDMLVEAPDSVACSPTARVKYSESDWCNCEDLGEYSDWGYYVDGHIHVTSSHRVQIDNFIYAGKGLSEWWDIRNEPECRTFYNALAQAHTDTVSQILMYEVINGVMNSTDWVTDVGAFLRDIAAEAKNAIDGLISTITPIKAFTVSETNALIAGASSRSVPATRVANILDTAVAAGANCANDLLNMVSIMGDDGLTAISDTRSKEIINALISISVYKDVGVNALQDDRTKKCTTSFLSTYTQRFYSSIVSSGGCDSEVADAGVGTAALYPSLFAATIPADDIIPLLKKGSILLPFDKSYAVISKSTFNGCVDVAWYARCKGGSDIEIYSMAKDSAQELMRLFNTCAGPLGYEATLIWPDGALDMKEFGFYLYAGLNWTSHIKLSGKLLETVPGIGHQLSEMYRDLTSDFDESEAVTGAANVAFNLSVLDNVRCRITLGNEVITDPAETSIALMEVVLAAFVHGAFTPFGSDEQLRGNRFGIICPGNPYFRYIYIGEHEDYAPLIITAFTLLTAVSARTTLRAWANPARDPSFLPLLVASSAGSAAGKSLSAAYQGIAASNDPTLAMQNDILNSINEAAAGQGTYTDGSGTVTLRDIIRLCDDMDSTLEQTQEVVNELSKGATGTFLTY